MVENKKTPRIRFSGFTDDWEQRKLSEVLIRRQINQQISNDTPRLAFAAGQGVIPLSERKTNNRDQLIADEATKRYLLTEYNDIVYNPANLKYGAIDRNKYGRGVISPIYVTFTTEEVPSFIERIVVTEKFKIKALQFEEGTVVKRQMVNPENLLSFEEWISPNNEEQQQIGDFFDNLDNLINLYQRKYDKLVVMKKSMLEKMYPKNGTNVPEIRFERFTDSWEQRKFSDITYLAGEKNRNNIPYQSYSISNEKGFIPQDEQFENGGTMKEADKSMYLIVQPNSFAYNPARINVGSIGYYDLPENVIVSSLYEVFKTSDDIDDRFLWHWFKSDLFPKFIERYQEGGVRMYFYYNKLCMCALDLPSIEEQKKIGKYFDKFDNLITLHQRKLEKLKKIKKSMLEKMFV